MKKFSILLSFLLIIVIIPPAFAQYEDKVVVLETSSGNLTIEFFPDDAPKHVENFIH